VNELGDFCDVPDAAALLAAGETWGYPLMLKARTLAYDGRGNAVVRSAAEAESAFSSLSRGGAVPLYAERWAEFVSELAVMVARARDGTVVTYPLTVTEQRDSMCHTVVAPAPVAASVSEQAIAVARKAISSL